MGRTASNRIAGRLGTDAIGPRSVADRAAALVGFTMNYKFYRVESFEITGPYQLSLTFDDGSSQTIDFTPVLVGEMFGPLRDLDFFNQVRLDKEVHTLAWPNGADFNPAMLHDWNSNLDKMAASVARWEPVAA